MSLQVFPFLLFFCKSLKRIGMYSYEFFFELFLEFNSEVVWSWMFVCYEVLNCWLNILTGTDFLVLYDSVLDIFLEIYAFFRLSNQLIHNNLKDLLRSFVFGGMKSNIYYLISDLIYQWLNSLSLCESTKVLSVLFILSNNQLLLFLVFSIALLVSSFLFLFFFSHLWWFFPSTNFGICFVYFF